MQALWEAVVSEHAAAIQFVQLAAEGASSDAVDQQWLVAICELVSAGWRVSPPAPDDQGFRDFAQAVADGTITPTHTAVVPICWCDRVAHVWSPPPDGSCPEARIHFADMRRRW